MPIDDDAVSPRLGWSTRTVTGSAAELHRLDDFDERSLTLCVPRTRAVVLGSTQDAADVDVDRAAALGLEVVRRRSGGGAVFVDPIDSIWIDAWIPRADPLWVDDVSTSMSWLGRAFAAILADVIGAGAEIDVAAGAFEAGEHGRSICFLSTAPGEVLVRGDSVGADRGDRFAGKVVGISQRRDRRGARLQSVLYRRWEPGRWAVFGDAALARALDEVAVHPVDLEPADVLSRLVAHLNAGG